MEKIKKGVRLAHISKIYQDPKTGKDFYAVKDTSLTIAPGSFVTLLGPSGCGKTTTLRMIAGFESPDEGEIYLGDEPINALTRTVDDIHAQSVAQIVEPVYGHGVPELCPAAPLQCV